MHLSPTDLDPWLIQEYTYSVPKQSLFSLHLNRLSRPLSHSEVFTLHVTNQNHHNKNLNLVLPLFFQKFYSQTLMFQIGQSAQKLTLLAQGQGLQPRLEFSPSVLELGPLLPYSPGDEGEVVVRNPCSFPIEFYSLEFDQQYLLEEKVSRGRCVFYSFIRYCRRCQCSTRIRTHM